MASGELMKALKRSQHTPTLQDSKGGPVQHDPDLAKEHSQPRRGESLPPQCLRIRAGLSLLLGALFLSTLRAQAPLTWLPRDLAARPLSLSAAYDSGRGRLVVVAGNQTWEWDGMSWTRRLTATSPSPFTSQQSMVYDSARHRVVMVGVASSSATWEYDGTDWLVITPPVSPPPRGLSALAYDAQRGRTVLFGGFNGAVSLADTWEWDGVTWTEVTPAVSPPPVGPSMAYDAARAEVVLFLGASETWTWDGTTWTQRQPATTPPSRTTAGMSYDPVRQRVVMFGCQFLNDTWEWDGTDWTEVFPTTPPSAGLDLELVWNPQTQRSVLLGAGFAGLMDFWE